MCCKRLNNIIYENISLEVEKAVIMGKYSEGDGLCQDKIKSHAARRVRKKAVLRRRSICDFCRGLGCPQQAQAECASARSVAKNIQQDIFRHCLPRKSEISDNLGNRKIILIGSSDKEA